MIRLVLATIIIAFCAAYAGASMALFQFTRSHDILVVGKPDAKFLLKEAANGKDKTKTTRKR